MTETNPKYTAVDNLTTADTLELIEIGIGKLATGFEFLTDDVDDRSYICYLLIVAGSSELAQEFIEIMRPEGEASGFAIRLLSDKAQARLAELLVEGGFICTERVEFGFPGSTGNAMVVITDPTDEYATTLRQLRREVRR